jgi:MFS family permease
VAGPMVGMGAGLYMFSVTSGFFVKPLASSFGWGRGQIAMASAAIFASSLVLPIAGVVADRFGIRALSAVGATVFVGCYIAFAMMTGAYWQYLTILALVGVAAGPATSPFVLVRPIVMTFDQSRGLALALAMSGVPIVSIAVLPALQHVIATEGWRTAYMLMASLSLILGIGCYALLGYAPRDAGPVAAALEAERSNPDDLAVPQVLVDPRFWLLTIAMISVNFSVGVFLNCLQPLMSDKGVAGETAGLLGVWQVLAQAGGRLTFGALLDRFWPPLVGCIALAGPLCGLSILQMTGAQTLFLAIGIGFVAVAIGAELDVLPYLTSRYFGLRSFGTMNSILGAIAGMSVAIGGLAAGFDFDRFGNYGHVLLGGCAMSAIAAATVLASGLVRRAWRQPNPFAG